MHDVCIDFSGISLVQLLTKQIVPKLFQNFAQTYYEMTEFRMKTRPEHENEIKYEHEGITINNVMEQHQ